MTGARRAPGSTRARSWSDVWRQRQAELGAGSVIEALLALDGYDTGFGAVDPTAWEQYLLGWAERLGMRRGSSVFEIGCGAGAVLLPLAHLGCVVSGIDLSPALIDVARQVMPNGTFSTGEAIELDPAAEADVVVSFGVFLYFPSLDYAARVLGAAAAKARRAVAVFDIPDIRTRDAAIAERVATVGGADAYAARYAGLDHQYYDREWFEETLRRVGLASTTTVSQDLPGYANGKYRFNAVGWKAG